MACISGPAHYAWFSRGGSQMRLSTVLATSSVKRRNLRVLLCCKASFYVNTSSLVSLSEAISN